MANLGPAFAGGAPATTATLVVFICLYLTLFGFVLKIINDREDLNPQEVNLKLSTMILWCCCCCYYYYYYYYY